jgi:phosphoribosyl-AMP cyclohydrolase
MTDLSRTAISEYWAALKPNEQGLVPVVTTEASSNVVLMMAWMNQEAFTKTFSCHLTPRTFDVLQNIGTYLLFIM